MYRDSFITIKKQKLKTDEKINLSFGLCGYGICQLWW